MAKKTVQKPARTRTSKPRKQPSVRKTAAQQPTSSDQIRRKFKGKELVIDVIDGQFVYGGQTFTSLSALATSIVGYGISGPHFFRMAMPKPGKQIGGE